MEDEQEVGLETNNTPTTKDSGRQEVDAKEDSACRANGGVTAWLVM